MDPSSNMNHDRREGLRRSSRLALPRRHRLLPSQYPRCRHKYCTFITGMGMSCKHQLYAAILFDSGMPLRIAVNVAMKKHRFR